MPKVQKSVNLEESIWEMIEGYKTQNNLSNNNTAIEWMVLKFLNGQVQPQQNKVVEQPKIEVSKPVGKHEQSKPKHKTMARLSKNIFANALEDMPE